MICRLARRLVLVLLMLSAVAFADCNCSNTWFYGNTGGTLTYNPTTQTLSLSSTVTETISGTSVQTGTFGLLTVTTGPLTLGSLVHHAFFGAGTISVGGYTGTLYSLDWYQVPNSDEFHLAGTGELGNLQIVNFDELVAFSSQNQYTVLSGKVGLTPEPSTVSLFITGIGLIFGTRTARFRQLRRRLSDYADAKRL